MDQYLYLILLGVFFAYFMLNQHLIQKYSKELKDALVNHPENFFNLIEKPIVKFLFQKSGLEFIKLNYYMTHGTKEEVEQQFNILEGMKMNKKQHNTLYESLLQYYITNDDEESCLKLKERYHEFVDANNLGEQTKTNFDMEIEMYFHKPLSAIPFIDEKIEFASEAEKVVWNYKKALILKENDRIDEAKECLKYILEASADENQKKIIQEALDNDLETL